MKGLDKVVDKYNLKLLVLGHPYPKSRLDSNIQRYSEEYDFKLPQGDSLFCFYWMNTADTMGANLFVPDYDEKGLYHHVFHHQFPSLSLLDDLAKYTTKKMDFPMMNVHEGDRWSLPKIQLYENGEFVRGSAYTSGEPFNPNFVRDDENALRENGKQVAQQLDYLNRSF